MENGSQLLVVKNHPCLIAVMFLLVGIFIIACCLYFTLSQRKLYELCDTTTSAVVVDVEHRWAHQNSEYSGIAYYPLYQFHVNGQPIIVKSNIGTSSPRYQVGEKVELVYYSQNPYQFYVAGDHAGTMLSTVFYIAGGICTLVGICLFVVLYRYSHGMF